MAKLKLSRHFWSVPNKCLWDKNLSLKAKGIYAFIQAKPEDWNFSAEGIASETSDGRDAIRSGLKELEEAFFLERIKTRTQFGTWNIEYILHEKPYQDGLSDDGKSVMVTVTDYPTTENPTTDNPSIIKTIRTKQLEQNNIETDTIVSVETGVSNWIISESLSIKNSEKKEIHEIPEIQKSPPLENQKILNVPPVLYGDSDINDIIRAITEAHGTIDDTVKNNRRYWSHLKNKISKIPWFDWRYYDFIFMICTKSDCYRISKTTSCRFIYDNLALLISNLKTAHKKSLDDIPKPRWVVC